MVPERETETEARVGAKQNVVRVKESNLYKDNNKMKNARNSTSLSRSEKRKNARWSL
jgi:hypothetical protein